MYTYIHIYKYIKRERERERNMIIILIIMYYLFAPWGLLLAPGQGIHAVGQEALCCYSLPMYYRRLLFEVSVSSIISCIIISSKMMMIIIIVSIMCIIN